MAAELSGAHFLKNLPLVPLLPPSKLGQLWEIGELNLPPFCPSCPFCPRSGAFGGDWDYHVGRRRARRERRTGREGCRVGRAWSCVLWSEVGSEPGTDVLYIIEECAFVSREGQWINLSQAGCSDCESASNGTTFSRRRFRGAPCPTHASRWIRSGCLPRRSRNPPARPRRPRSAGRDW